MFRRHFLRPFSVLVATIGILRKCGDTLSGRNDLAHVVVFRGYRYSGTTAMFSLMCYVPGWAETPRYV